MKMNSNVVASISGRRRAFECYTRGDGVIKVDHTERIQALSSDTIRNPEAIKHEIRSVATDTSIMKQLLSIDFHLR